MLRLLLYILFGYVIISVGHASWWENKEFLDNNQVFAKIIEIRPQMDKNAALSLSNDIHRVSVEYGVDKLLYTAILAQESMFRLDAQQCYKGLADCGKIERVCQDFGIAQIHYKTAKAYGFSKQKLLTDREYSLKAGAKVLLYFKERYVKVEKERWWTRYNCGTKPDVMRNTCQEYYERVRRYL